MDELSKTRSEIYKKIEKIMDKMYGFRGTIEDVNILPYALTSKEVETRYNMDRNI